MCRRPVCWMQKLSEYHEEAERFLRVKELIHGGWQQAQAHVRILQVVDTLAHIWSTRTYLNNRSKPASPSTLPFRAGKHRINHPLVYSLHFQSWPYTSLLQMLSQFLFLGTITGVFIERLIGDNCHLETCQTSDLQYRLDPLSLDV